ncbi:MAG TPA: cation:proton antiporter [Alphaproteobacteria bacterium]|nr:cation:proton antiporter [Alphaproteobacteria bacterium]
MYQTTAVIAGFLLLYTAVSGRVERSWFSGPLSFIGAGLLLGPYGLRLLDVDLAGGGIRFLAEGTLAMVLFTDAANADFAVVKRNVVIWLRLLLIGLPLTIVLGFLAGSLIPGLNLLEAALLATILAPTDAALGKPVLTNTSIPAALRESLNLESGLNDGICVPVIVILLDLAVGTQIEGYAPAHIVQVVAEEIGIGLVFGLAATGCAVALLRATVKLDWVSEEWVQVPVVALAALCYAGAQAIGGSGFIACFVGGLMVSWLAPRRKHELLKGAESIGETLAMLTWVAFGAIAITQIYGGLSVSVVLYALLSLTVIRMVPVFLCLIGTRTSAADKLFVGWFGPRGLASIVFGILVFNQQLPGNDTLQATVMCTVLLSVIAHGVTATPLSRALGARAGSAGIGMVA